MNLSIFGLGYVGCVSAACFARDCHSGIGVDVNPQKGEMINAGRSPSIEPGLYDVVKSAVESSRLKATLDPFKAVSESDVSMVCVGTPGASNGSLDLSHVKRACAQIGEALAQKDRYHVVVIRSTV